jgi:iron(III) transport system ATP-binding protein
VALARSLVTRPKLLLLDEPLSNLDAKLREEMRYEIKELTGRLGISTIYVTHDQAEALSMSDRIAVMSEGRILQMDAPRKLYLEPVTPTVARIVGNVNVLDGTAEPGAPGSDEVTVVLQSGTRLQCRKGPQGCGSAKVSVMFRPELVRTRAQHSTPTDRDHDANILQGRVGRIDFTGDHLRVQFETPDGPVFAKLPPDNLLVVGEAVEIMVRRENCVAH